MTRQRTNNWLHNAYWPDIYDAKSAEAAKWQGVVAAGFCSLATFILVIFRWTSPGSLADAVVFGLIAAGIYKSWPETAIAGLTIYVLERIYAWRVHGVKQPIVAAILVLAFVNSARGTFWLSTRRRKISIAGDKPDRSRSPQDL